MRKGYKNPAILELCDQQVRYAPREKRIEQTDRAERLYYEVLDDISYSYKFICRRITDYRAEFHADLMIPGSSLRHDLRLLIEDLSAASEVQIETLSEKAWTLEELADRFNVSIKTISRWRTAGLISRYHVFSGKTRLSFLNSSVDEFIERNPERINQGSVFSRLNEEEKNRIVMAARRIANGGAGATETAKRLAREFGRSVETIRTLIKTFDAEHKDIAIFPQRSSPLREETRAKVFQEFRRGEPVQRIAEKYHRTPGSVYRVLGQMRAKRIAELPLDYIENPDFETFRKSKRDSDILAAMPVAPDFREEKPRRGRPQARKKSGGVILETVATFHEEPSEDHPSAADLNGLPPYLAELYEVSLLNQEQETHLFRKLNYLKYLASYFRATLNPDNPKTLLMDKIEELYERSVNTKNDIVTANLRLVVSIAKKHVNIHSHLYELVSDGNLALIRAVEKFDYARGIKFSTYASWAIIRNFARTIPGEKKYHERFHAGEDEVFTLHADKRSDIRIAESTQIEREIQIDHLMQTLDEREQSVLTQRYGLGENRESQSLRQVGDGMNITKERVRQIEARALAKLRKVAEEERLDIPGLE